MILRLQDLRLNGDKLERTFDKVLVSACLIGQKVRYDGSAKLAGHAIIERWHNEGRIVALCPEVAAVT